MMAAMLGPRIPTVNDVMARNHMMRAQELEYGALLWGEKGAPEAAEIDHAFTIFHREMAKWWEQEKRGRGAATHAM